MTPDKPYFCRSQSGAESECHETMEAAIDAGKELQLAPFTVFVLTAHPVHSCMFNSPTELIDRKKQA